MLAFRHPLQLTESQLKTFELKRKNNGISIVFCYNNTIKGVFMKFRVAIKYGMSFNSVNRLS